MQAVLQKSVSSKCDAICADKTRCIVFSSLRIAASHSPGHTCASRESQLPKRSSVRPCTSNATPAMADKSVKTNATAANGQTDTRTPRTSETLGHGTLATDSSAAQPAHDCSSPPGIVCAYFNLWDSDDAHDNEVLFIVVPMTRHLHHEEEMELVAYFCRYGLKRIPSDLPVLTDPEDGSKFIYILPAQTMRQMHKLAVESKETECVAITQMGTTDFWTMYVKRMTVTKENEITEVCERAAQKVVDMEWDAVKAAMALFFGNTARLTDALANRPLQPATYLTSCPPAAAPGDSSGFYRIAFHNISSGRECSNMDDLATKICEMVRNKSVDAVGIGGLPLALQVSDIQNVDKELICQTSEMWSSVLLCVLSRLNRNAERPAWKGRSDGHYIFVWNSERLMLSIYNYVSCGIEEQPWRMAQYLLFRDTESQTGPPLHVCHCHSPSDKVTERRAGPMPQRARTFETLWGHVMRNDPVEDPDSATQPVSIFGGNFDCTAQQWLLCLKRAAATQASRRSVQIIGDAIFNDQATVFNAFAAREDLGCMPGNDHDVVLVSLCWRRHTPANTASAVVAEATSGPAPPTKSALRATPY